MGIKVTCTIDGHGSRSKKTPANIIKEGMETGLVMTCNGLLSKTLRYSRLRQIKILAIFFQRLCARTPLDETYKTPSGMHKPDDDFTRYHWYLKLGNFGILTSENLVNAFGPAIFYNFNDKDSIKLIEKAIDSILPKKEFIKDVEVGNDTDTLKFNMLEYGGFTTNKEHEPYEGEHEQHGVRNKHSIQAPVGMLRITKAELDKIIKSTALTNEATRYSKQKAHRLPNEKELNAMINLLRKSRIPFSDIKGFYE